MTIPEILDRHGVPYRAAGQHHHVRDGWIGVECPWCGGSSGSYHLGISLANGYATCWRCGYHMMGDVLAALTGLPLPACLDMLKQAPRSLHVAAKGRSQSGRLKLPSGLQSLTGPHRRYLEGRGFDPDEIARLWGIMGIGMTALLRWRIWIPIHRRGEVVSWTTRAIGGSGSRYVSAAPDEEAVDHKTLLYGADHARHAVIVCEGPTDVWRLGYGAVATMGLSCTVQQTEAMAGYPVRAVCFDAEPGARARARRLVAALKERPGETCLIELESGPDVATADPSEVEEMRKRFLN